MKFLYVFKMPFDSGEVSINTHCVYWWKYVVRVIISQSKRVSGSKQFLVFLFFYEIFDYLS